MENTCYYNGCTIEFKSDSYEFYEEYKLEQKIPIAKILDIDFVHFNEATIKMFVSVVFSEIDGMVTSRYILDYTHKDRPAQTIEIEGLSNDIVNNGILNKIKAYLWRDANMEYSLRVYNDVIDVAIKQINEIKLNNITR